MKKVLLIILIMSPCLLKAQILVDTNKVWNVKTCLNFGGCGTTVLQFGTDTTIGIHQYKNLMVNNDSGYAYLVSYPFAVREDTITKKVYFYEDNAEHLAYDFSLTQGSTFISKCGIPMLVDSVDSVTLLSGEIRKRIFFLNNSEIWIEGVGSLFGLPYPGIYDCAFDIYFTLICFKENDTLKYQDAFYTNCFYNTLGVSALDGQNRFHLRPNPFTDFTMLKFENSNQEVVNLSIYDTSGRLLRQTFNIDGNEVEIKRNEMGSGIYFFRIMSESRLISNGKFVIQ